MNTVRMLAQLELHEDFRATPYKDTDDPPNWTFGIGYNYTARGPEFFERIVGRKLGPLFTLVVTRAEAEKVALADIARIERAVITHFPEYLKLDEVRQRVVVDIAFNIGYTALDFQRCILAIKTKNWSQAAIELYRSRWYRQVGGRVALEGADAALIDMQVARTQDRADRLASMLLTGRDWV